MNSTSRNVRGDFKVIGAGDIIRNVRFKNGLSLRGLAKMANMPESTLSRYETNERPLMLSTIVAIASSFNESPEEVAFKCVCRAFPGIEAVIGQSLKTVVDFIVSEL